MATSFLNDGPAESMTRFDSDVIRIDIKNMCRRVKKKIEKDLEKLKREESTFEWLEQP